MAIALVACSQPAGTGTAAGTARSDAPRTESQRTYVAAIRLEPITLALRSPRETFAGTTMQTRLFNADISVFDDRAAPAPYLAEALPQLNTDTWRVFPDGRMETTYRLRPNLTWHDGTAFSAQDFAFGWRFYTSPEIGFSRQPPFDSIEDVQAPDPRTLLVRWSKPYPDAAHMHGRDRNLPALPRHLLEAQFASEPIDLFLALPFWTRDFIGTGPFRVVNWEPGSFIDTVAFAGHAIGKPKIERLQLRFIGDSNTALASVLNGDIHLSGDSALGTEQGITLKREWDQHQGGLVHYAVSTWRGADFQLRRNITNPQALLDARVRKAMIHGVDRDIVNEVVNHGMAPNAIFLLPVEGIWGKAIEQGAVKYPYDPRAAEELMRQAGFERGSDSFFTSASQGKFTVEVKTTSAQESQNELAAMADNWRQNGFDVAQTLVPNAQFQDLEVRAGYPGLFILSVPVNERFPVSFVPDSIPMADNGWRGSNRSGWTNPAYTELIGQFMSTLDFSQRETQLAQMARIFTDDAPTISIGFRPIVWTYTADTKGPKPVPVETNPIWNIHEWAFR